MPLSWQRVSPSIQLLQVEALIFSFISLISSSCPSFFISNQLSNAVGSTFYILLESIYFSPSPWHFFILDLHQLSPGFCWQVAAFLREGNGTPLQYSCLEIPWTEEPGRLQSMRSLRVGQDWATSLSCIGEGNGNQLQCSCLENPRDRGAWGAAVYGVAQSRTRLKWLSSSSSSFSDFPTSSRTSLQTVPPTTSRADLLSF